MEKQNIITKMEDYHDKSKELYKVCCEEGCENVINPILWIFNQDKMRYMYELHKKNIETQKEPFKTIMLNNSLSKYMKFMYDTYPCGFGNEMKRCYDNNIEFDGANIFIKLMNN